jgi:hypothetical protein
MAVTLRKQQIIDSWKCVIEGGSGNSERFFRSVEQYLKNANMPNVTVERTQVVTSRLFGQGRESIIVRHKSLHEFTTFISARDFGSFLDIAWVVTLNPGFLQRQFSKTVTGSGYGLTFRSLDVFLNQELEAYTTITLRGVIETTKNIHESLKQDFTKVNMRSKSGLAAW